MQTSLPQKQPAQSREPFREACKSAGLPLPKKQPEQSRALRVNEALEQYALSRTSFYKLVKAGRIRLVKIGSRSLVSRDQMEKLIAGEAV